MTLEIDHDAALVLLALLVRFDHTEVLSLEHPAETAALWALQGALDRVLVEPFDRRYDELLAPARARVAERAGS